MSLDFDIRQQWAENIKQARKTKKLTQKALGVRCGVDQCTVSRWERGKLIPTEDNKRKVAKATDQDPREMFPL